MLIVSSGKADHQWDGLPLTAREQRRNCRRRDTARVREIVQIPLHPSAYLCGTSSSIPQKSSTYLSVLPNPLRFHSLQLRAHRCISLRYDWRLVHIEIAATGCACELSFTGTVNVSSVRTELDPRHNTRAANPDCGKSSNLVADPSAHR